MVLTSEQRKRYQRNLMLNEVGEAGQEALLGSKVLVVGAGGLGSPVLLYLAAAGVGTIGIVDGDHLEVSNLQRQIIHGMAGLNHAKVDSARQRIADINPDVQVEAVNCRLTAENGAAVVGGYDFVVEAADNFATKFLVNDLCLQASIAFSHGGILEFTGQTMTVVPGRSRCYRCVFQRQPPPHIADSCSQAGVLGAVAGIIGSIQAGETLKYLLGIGGLLDDSLLVCDALTMRFRRIPTRARSGCICQ